MLFHFELHDAGWATVFFAQGAASHELPFSYLRDSPRDMIEAVVRLLRGSAEERVTFMQEPGEVVLQMRRLAGDLIHLKLFEGEDWGMADVAGGEPVFRHKLPLARLPGIVEAEFGRMLRESSPADYQARWGFAFPAQPLEEMRARLR
ncbi:hypothetical protein [Longimicrobium terrae]|uniref:Uncharacterized protein n=1 Tax=Longimicrobium terrae TaxID=1639882 RepID=A0A841H407_9BACT|nr:hypothetical protein [Longimicrobium terrae]MBB4638296.1 hypothetical protein [Longimicrobium terrae]MBB6072636.1 hypothetical protein [Longimicrobium terrae]NNC28585.1 hypothetical protein [Longimicrobium terrae]